MGVRLSIFDTVPYQTGRAVGRPYDYAGHLPYQWGFGVEARNPLQMDLAEPIELLKRLKKLCVVAVNLSAGSPYYCPHLQRPAAFPPSDGYLPPEDPLLSVWRQIDAAATMQGRRAGLRYDRHRLLVLAGLCSTRGPGRGARGRDRCRGAGGGFGLSRTSGREFADRHSCRKRVCRTFSDCTTGPREGYMSGCFPLDPYYKALPEANAIKAVGRHSAEDEKR